MYSWADFLAPIFDFDETTLLVSLSVSDHITGGVHTDLLSLEHVSDHKDILILEQDILILEVEHVIHPFFLSTAARPPELRTYQYHTVQYDSGGRWLAFVAV